MDGLAERVGAETGESEQYPVDYSGEVVGGQGEFEG